MARLTPTIQRLAQSAVVWSWAMNGLRLASGVVVLPLLIHHLSGPDFGMYFVLLSLSALVPILDLGFATSIGRAVSYAMGGAKELQAQGYAPEIGANGPNYELLGRLLPTARQLYRLLSLASLLLLGATGTVMVAVRVNETSAPAVTWIAWGVTLVAAVWEIYAGWWNVFLRGMDQVRLSTQLGALAMTVRILLSCLLLMGGAGLLSVPLATLIGSVLQRELSRRAVLRALPKTTTPATAADVKQLVATLWPNSWRIGLQFSSGYLAGHANTLVCQTVFGLAAAAEYGFSLQLVIIGVTMAQVWTLVKWPMVGKLRIKSDHPALRKTLWPRVWLQTLTYLAMALGVVLVVPVLLRWAGSDKSTLPVLWFSLLALQGLLEMNYSFWGTLISTENRMPFVWPIIISNLASFLVVLVLVNTTRLGLAAFVISPLVVGCLYNHWKWPREGARSIGTNWWRFMSRKW
ncbi:MAG: hypothetical protein IH623_27030 [Verrucomicrobia bacterium]|nr:hypothetical protein [Verrucomicrobiota bacterium]